MTSSPDVIGTIWINFISMFKSYVLGIKRLFIFLFEIGFLLMGITYYKKNRNIFLFSMVGLSFFSLSILFLKPFTSRYFSPVLIFSLLIYIHILNLSKKKSRFRNILILVGLLYLLNNVAGDLYIIKRDYRNTSYNILEKKIDLIIPDNSAILSYMHFWFPLKNNENFNSYTRWNKKDYNSLDDLFESGDLDYVVISDFLTSGITMTSGRKLARIETTKHNKYYNKLHNFAQNNGKLVKTISTNNYSDIEIWEINKNFP